MQVKIAVKMLAGFVVLANVCFAQSDVAMLLSRAMSADGGGASAADTIALYRQVLAAPSDQRVYAAYSQFRIVELTLETGDISGAAAELSTLAQKYSEFKDFFSTQLGQNRIDVHPGAGVPGPSLLDPDGRFRYPSVGVELNTQGWSAVAPRAGGGIVGPSSGGGVALILTDLTTNNQVMVWMLAEHVPRGDLPKRMGSSADGKALQRLSYQDYRIRPGSVRNLTINGSPAVARIADFTRNGQPWNELITSVQTESSWAAFIARVPASQLAAFQPRFDSLAATTVLSQPSKSLRQAMDDLIPGVRPR